MNRAIRGNKISLRQILIASLISQVLVAVGLTGYFSWKNGRKTVEDLALRLSREVTSHTQKHVANYLNTPSTFLKINRVFNNLQRLDLNNQQDLQDIFWQQAKINPEINTLYFGSETGDFVEIELKDPPKLSIRNLDTAPYWETYRLDEQGKATTLLEKKPYDPRQRPWYRAAIEHGDLIWSPIYLFADPPVLGITPAIPLKDVKSNKIKGVMAIDLTLEDISQFLNSLKISDSGRAFIIEKSGKMVATSTGNSLIRRNALGNERLHYSDTSDLLIEATGAFIETKLNYFKDIEHTQQIIFKFEGNRHFVQVASLEGYPGLDWLMVTVIPESDFMSYIRTNTYMTLLLSSLALISAIFLGAIANRLIINSVTRISDVAKAISSGQVLAIERQPKIKELAVVTESINSMALQLKASARNIENLESQWEQRVEETTKNLRQVNLELNRLANIDSLTQIYNRYYFDLALKQLWQESIAERGVISLIMCDVDNFKLYNDTYGHLMGDECLKQVARKIYSSVNRDRDIAARYGGEEFVVILPRTNGEGAIQVSNNIRNALIQLNIPHETSTVTDRVTISCGVACIVPNPNCSAYKLIQDADTALYRAKQRGKNCSVLAEQKYEGQQS
ncbi:diguanylate cyclase [Waterburya agarophytonicola K14]|uniref:Diguanylate cyclase n=1 Tax=Waterburya agarophytonicola KI4 TaxID=2874699 RepID=A0A964FIH5_9CYAN|nr:diguanylate cyclase [Waterburya agarophytonicola]MCC0178484.1 diguanylate cyclase [Waterburya agarophytonicola KI4]